MWLGREIVVAGLPPLAVSALSLNQIYLKDKILKAYSQNIKFV